MIHTLRIWFGFMNILMVILGVAVGPTTKLAGQPWWPVFSPRTPRQMPPAGSRGRIGWRHDRFPQPRLRLHLHAIHRLEALAQHRFGGVAEPVLQQGGVNLAEVGVVFQVAIDEVG